MATGDIKVVQENIGGTYDEIVLEDSSINVNAVKLFHGIEQYGALSFDNSGHILTMASGTNTYWFQGTKYTTASAITCDIDDYETLAANTLYYFYFDDATGTLKCADSLWNLKTMVPVATVYWNGSAGAVQLEAHNHTRDLDWHINAHLTIGARYNTGLSLTAPTTAADATLQIETGSIYDEDLLSTIAQSTTMRGWYQASAGVYTWADYSLPYLGTSGDPYWLDTDDYTLKSVDDNKYVNYWVYATSDISRPIYIIPTQAADPHSTLASARAATPPALSGLSLNPEWKLIYKFIYKGDGQFQESVDYRTASGLPSGGTALVAAAGVTFVPYGNIASSNVQAALSELDDEKMTNPMTASGDIIYGGTSGAPTRLAKGDDGQYLKLASGVPSWAAGGGGLANVVEDTTPQLGGTLDCQENDIDNVGDIIHDDATASDWTFKNQDQDKDIIFNGNDGGSDTVIMKLDVSEGQLSGMLKAVSGVLTPAVAETDYLTKMAIWTALTGSYASTTTFTFTGVASDVNKIQFSLLTCTDSAGTTRRIGYVKSASESSGTVTVTVVTDTNLASGDKDFKVAYNRKVFDYMHMVSIPGEQIADTSYSQGVWLLDLKADSYLLPVDAAVRTAASGSGAALTFNIYKDTTALFNTAPDLSTNAVLVEQRPTTNTLSAGEDISLRIVSSAGATNKAADFQAKLYIIPQLLFTAFT